MIAIILVSSAFYAVAIFAKITNTQNEEIRTPKIAPKTFQYFFSETKLLLRVKPINLKAITYIIVNITILTAVRS